MRKTPSLQAKKYPIVSEKKVLYKSLVDAYNAAPSQRGRGRLLEGRPEDGSPPSTNSVSGYTNRDFCRYWVSVLFFLLFLVAMKSRIYSRFRLLFSESRSVFLYHGSDRAE